MTELTVTVHIPSEISRDLSALANSKRKVTEKVCVAIERSLRDHFEQLQDRPRKDGFQPTGFWSGYDHSVAEHISGHVLHDDGKATVTIDSPELRHKLDGGVIKASDYGHKYLTLPANNEAAHAAQGARSFQSHIEWVPHPDGGIRPALVSDSNYVRTSRSRKTGEVKRKFTLDETKANAGMDDVLFWLVRKVTHKPMPGALPSDSVLGEAARAAALDALDALVASNRGAA